MTDHLQTLRDLVAAGEKATPTRDATLMRYDHGGGRFYREVERERSLIADFYDEANREFYFAAANARPALAALLRIVEAASKRLNQLDPLRAVIEIAERDGYLRALNPEVLARRLISEFEQQDALRAALRDLSPEVEDGE